MVLLTTRVFFTPSGGTLQSTLCGRIPSAIAKATRFSTIESQGGATGTGGFTARVSPDGKWVAYSLRHRWPWRAVRAIVVRDWRPVSRGLSWAASRGGRPTDGSCSTRLAARSTWSHRPHSLASSHRRRRSRRKSSGFLTTAGDDYDVLPDGRFVTTASKRTLGPDSRQINVVVNWIEEVKRLTRAEVIRARARSHMLVRTEVSHVSSDF